MSFMEHNPKWSFILWDEETIGGLPDAVRELALDESLPYVVRGDYLRYVVCSMFGGVYTDLDVKCQKPFGPLLHCRNFAGEGYEGQYCNAVIGCEEENPLFSEIAEAVYASIIINYKQFPANVIQNLYTKFPANIAAHGGVIFQAPYLAKCEKIYPLHYFNPFPWNNLQRDKPWEDSYAVHQWYGMDPDGWVKKPYN